MLGALSAGSVGVVNSNPGDRLEAFGINAAGGAVTGMLNAAGVMGKDWIPKGAVDWYPGGWQTSLYYPCETNNDGQCKE